MWVLGMVNTTTSPAVSYMEIVDARDAATLLPVINTVVQQWSIIYSDKWRAYRNINGQRDVHRTVNHYLNFVDPQTRVHTQFSND